MPFFMLLVAVLCFLCAKSESNDKARSASFVFFGVIALGVALITAI